MLIKSNLQRYLRLFFRASHPCKIEIQTQIIAIGFRQIYTISMVKQLSKIDLAQTDAQLPTC
jgi:hypothetical protein